MCQPVSFLSLECEKEREEAEESVVIKKRTQDDRLYDRFFHFILMMKCLAVVSSSNKIEEGDTARDGISFPFFHFKVERKKEYAV